MKNMSIHTVISCLKKHKGKFQKPHPNGTIRHCTLLDCNNHPCCPISVVAHEKGFKLEDITNGCAMNIADKLGIEYLDAKMLIRAADGLTSSSHPYRILLENTCL